MSLIEVKVLVSGKPSTTIVLSEGDTLSDLRVALRNNSEMSEVAEKNFQRDSEVMTNETTLNDGDRVTLYTKVEGGA